MPGPLQDLRELVAATRPRPLPGSGAAESPWTRAALAGRLVELSGASDAASLTFAVSLVLDAQRRGEVVAWVTSRDSSFHPPDADENGYVALPNVDQPQEMVDMLSAARAYQANLTAIGLIRDLVAKALELGK